MIVVLKPIRVYSLIVCKRIMSNKLYLVIKQKFRKMRIFFIITIKYSKLILIKSILMMKDYIKKNKKNNIILKKLKT